MIFFVVSLPRTGTTSMCRMADICGMKALHVLKKPKAEDYLLGDALADGYNFFADTPFYLPEFLCGFLESGRRDVGFVYIHKDREAWDRSLGRLYEKWRPRDDLNKKIVTMDHMSRNYMLNNPTIDEHHGYMVKLAGHYGVRMLDYRWGDGWPPFCDFVGASVPDLPVPHLDVLS